MITTPDSEQNTDSAVEPQDATAVASIKLDDVTGGWWGGGPYAYGYGWGSWGFGGPGPSRWPGYAPGYAYGPRAAARYAAYEDRAAKWYAANSPPFPPWA